jgi:AAA+ ATPase superfamily predicted ATPase
MDFPFIFGRIVVGPQFINRKAELSKLKSNIEHGKHTVLISPRRWGKTSLIRHLSTKLSKNEQLKFIYIDLFRITDEVEFYETYTKEVLHAALSKLSDLGNLVKKFFKSINPGITFGNTGTGEFRVTLRWEDLKKNYHEIIDLPEKLSKKRNQKFVIFIDEFQSLDKFSNPEQFQSRLMSVWQHHSHVVYLLLGSKRHKMNDIFISENNPFFQFGEIMYLQKIKKKYFCRYIMSTFEKSGKTIPKERAEKIIKLADKIPYFIQQLARNVWISSSEMVVESDIQSAVEEILYQNAVWYTREVERMTTPQFNYLKAVMNVEKKLSGQDVIRKYKLGSSANVAKIKKVMEEREILDYWNPYPVFNDPFFKLWIQGLETPYS